MSPVLSPDGVTFLCDDIKAPLWSIHLALDFVKRARAARKIVVLGTISDHLEDSEGRNRAIARQALEAADHVVFLGSNAMYVLRDARRHPDGALVAVPTVEAARKHLQRLLRPGDLVLIKGSRADRMASLVNTRIAPPGKARAVGAASRAGASPAHVIVGLGNPGARYTNTPHNAGQRALDLVAASLGASWTTLDEALLARVDHPGGTCYLVKPRTKMNLTGPALGRLAERLGVGAADLILLHDEIALPLGSVRTRMSGSHGGHRGVLSVLDAFETFEIRRVKIGVGRPRQDVTVERHVLSVLGPAELAVLDEACAEAATRAGQLAGVRDQRRARSTASLTAPRTDTPDSSPS
jgi:aminoacyl-tRNA hydrolase